MRNILSMTAAFALFLLAGCAGVQSKYAWGSYESSLYSYYKAPSEINAFAEGLAKTIGDAEVKGLKVAPGVYAEYAHVLQQQGRYGDALTYYEKEKRAWPESTTFMNAMIESATAAQKKAQSPEKTKS